MELIRQEIDGKPMQSRMVSAILLGTVIAVPKGRTSAARSSTCRSATRRRRPDA